MKVYKKKKFTRHILMNDAVQSFGFSVVNVVFININKKMPAT